MIVHHKTQDHLSRLSNVSLDSAVSRDVASLCRHSWSHCQDQRAVETWTCQQHRPAYPHITRYTHATQKADTQKAETQEHYVHQENYVQLEHYVQHSNHASGLVHLKPCAHHVSE